MRRAVAGGRAPRNTGAVGKVDPGKRRRGELRVLLAVCCSVSYSAAAKRTASAGGS